MSQRKLQISFYTFLQNLLEIHLHFCLFPFLNQMNTDSFKILHQYTSKSMP